MSVTFKEMNELKSRYDFDNERTSRIAQVWSQLMYSSVDSYEDFMEELEDLRAEFIRRESLPKHTTITVTIEDSELYLSAKKKIVEGDMDVARRLLNIEHSEKKEREQYEALKKKYENAD